MVGPKLSQKKFERKASSNSEKSQPSGHSKRNQTTFGSVLFVVASYFDSCYVMLL